MKYYLSKNQNEIVYVIKLVVILYYLEIPPMSVQKFQARSFVIDAITGRKLDNILVVVCTLVKLFTLYILLNDSIIT